MVLTLLLLSALADSRAYAATQVGSAPYRASATGAGNSHSPVFSADGRHVAFVSHANNLVTNDDLGPHLDLFVRKLVTSNTVLVSVSTNGFGGANDNIGLYTLSSNAQVVAFDTAASNLMPWDNNRVSDIYVRDLVFGGKTRVTWGLDGDSDGPSFNPLISEDGRYVIFESLASNLVTNDFNGTNDIFIHDLMTGLTELVSVNADGTASPDGPSHSPSISADGLTVAFVSHATNVVEGATNYLGEVYARHVTAHTTHWAVASHIRETHEGLLSSGAYSASQPVLNADGRYVVFKTLGKTVRFDLDRPIHTILIYFTNPPPAWASVFRFDDNPRVSAAALAAPLGFSADGRFAACHTRSYGLSRTTLLLLVDFETTENVSYFLDGDPLFPHTFVTSAIPRTTILLSNGISGPDVTWTRLPWLWLNSDASRLFFVADGTNVVTGPANQALQLYGLNLPNGPLRLVSTNQEGLAGPDLGDIVPSISPDASLIAWDSPDDNIVADDLNRAWDVFVRNVDTGETQLASARHPDLPAASGIAMSRLDLNAGAINANGQRIAILSLDSTLAPNDTNHWRDLFVRDLVTGTNIDVSRSIGRVPFSSQTNFPGTNTAAAPSLSADGRYVAFSGEALFFAGSTNRTIYWRDLTTPSNRVVATGSQNNPAGVSHPVLSADGRLLAFHSADVHVPGFPDSNGQQDVFVSLRIRTIPLPGDGFPFDPCDSLGSPVASLTSSGMSTANAASVNPAFSPSANWILFQSLATDLTESVVNPNGRFQLYARTISVTVSNNCIPAREFVDYGPTRLVSYSTTASPAPNGTSTDLPLLGGGANPRFSADSRYVAFESSPNLIYRHDLLGAWVTNIMAHPDPFFPSFTNRARFTNDLVCSNCVSPTLNSDGRFIAYESLPVSGTFRDIVVKDLQTGQTELMSISMSGTNGNGSSFTPLLSHDARFVVFASKASDLVPGDNNRATDVFVRDRLNGVTHSLSRNWSGTGTGNRVSSNPIMSADGRTVAFQSFASDLVPGDYNDTRDVFVVTLGGPDTDGDGMDDDWEMAYFNTLSRDGSGDFDNDGASDLAEFRAGTNPANDASILRVLSISPVHDSPYALHQATVVWTAVPGRTYRVQFRDNAGGTMFWMDVPGDVVATTTSASKIHTPSYYTGYFTNHRFYRVLLVQ